MQLHHQATDPPILGVAVEQYVDSSGNGFVVCLIPESNFKPHRAEQDGKKQFYLRAGDDFVIMPVPVLRSMFYPRAKPILKVETGFTDAIEGKGRINWWFRIHNTGTATAKDVCLWIKPSGFFTDPVPGQECLMSGLDGTRGVCVICKLPIHPGIWRDVLALDEFQMRAHSIRFHEASFIFRLYATDSEPQTSQVRFGHVEFVNRDPQFATFINMPQNDGQ
jgi:hypothetical protein